MRRWLFLALLAVPACRRLERADEHLCGAIMERIVDLELGAMGIHDEELASRRRTELHRTLAPELKRCIGRRAPKDAHECVERARSMNELTHECLAL